MKTIYHLEHFTIYILGVHFFLFLSPFDHLHLRFIARSLNFIDKIMIKRQNLQIYEYIYRHTSYIQCQIIHQSLSRATLLKILYNPVQISVNSQTSSIASQLFSDIYGNGKKYNLQKFRSLQTGMFFNNNFCNGIFKYSAVRQLNIKFPSP